MGAQQRAQQYSMYTPRGTSPSRSESWLRRRMENIENHPQARLPGFARRYLFNVDTHPRIPVTNRHRELAEIEEALQKESHVRRGEMVLERRRRLAEQWRQQHSGGGSAAQQVAAAAQPEEDFEDVFETVNKYFRDLPDEDEVPATQSSGRRPPPPPPPSEPDVSVGYLGAGAPRDFVADVEGSWQQKISLRRANQLAHFSNLGISKTQ